MKALDRCSTWAGSGTLANIRLGLPGANVVAYLAIIISDKEKKFYSIEDLLQFHLIFPSLVKADQNKLECFPGKFFHASLIVFVKARA
jgi:hypothetical protein